MARQQYKSAQKVKMVKRKREKVREPHANGDEQERGQNEALDVGVGGHGLGGAAQQPLKSGGRLTRRAAAPQAGLLRKERPPVPPKGASDAGRRPRRCRLGRSALAASKR